MSAPAIVRRGVFCLAALGSGATLALLTTPASMARVDLPAVASAAHATAVTAAPPAQAAAGAPSQPAVPVVRSIDLALGAAFKRGMTITGTTPHRFVLFTFDDGPDRRTTPLLLDRLDEAGIKAIFFLVASRMALTTPYQREQAMLAREIVRRGHLVGGHTFDHAQLPLLDDDGVRAQLRGAEEVFERVLGARPWIYRPPFGAHSQRVDQLAAARGYTTVLWSLGGEDFQVHTAQEVYDTFLKELARHHGNGGIVLLHDTHPWSVDAFQMIVSHLLARNCELLDRHEELYDFVDDLSFFYVPRGNSPADAEAPPLEPDPAVLAARQARLRERTARRCKSMALGY